MKNLFAVIIFLLSSLLSFTAEAQIYSPQLRGHYGQRIIYYPNGYYQGNVNNGIAHGTGTYYFRDGSFFHGNFQNGYSHGQGVIVSPYYGYVAGCWYRGQYTGICSNQPSYSRRKVERTVEDVQEEKPNDSRYSSVTPEGYKIKQIDPETAMGRKILGRYSGY